MSKEVFEKLKAPFPPNQISWRAQTVTKIGDKALALAYLDARDVMERLDEVVGPGRWQNRYSHSDKKTVCEIGILLADDTDELPNLNPQWVWKADGAGDSDIEAEKGALSDAFKRAGVRWGIGRYLYDLDAVWVPCESREFNSKKQFVKFTDDPWNYVKKKSVVPEKPANPHDSQIELLGGRLRTAKDIKEIDDIAKQQATVIKWMSENAPDRHKAMLAYINQRKTELTKSGENNG